MKWSEGSYFAAWLNMLGNDERIDALHSGNIASAVMALIKLRNEYELFRQHEQMNNFQERT